MLYKVLIHCKVVKNSCTLVTRWSTSVIKVSVVYIHICVLRHLKEELGWAVDIQLWVFSNKMLFKTVIPLRN